MSICDAHLIKVLQGNFLQFRYVDHLTLNQLHRVTVALNSLTQPG